LTAESSRRRLLVDSSRCVGCGCCEFVCSLRNHGECNPARSLIAVVRLHDEGMIAPVPVTCRQCEEPLCVSVCPTGALRRRGDDVVVVDEGVCIGCRSCVEVCPWGAPSVDVRLGTSQKCALCDGDPACVKVCPEHAITFAAPQEEGLRRKRAAVEMYLEYLESATPAGRRPGETWCSP
jgi:anaerobic carbon-monoxide dehydrogenase iron sulfur subunit